MMTVLPIPELSVYRQKFAYDRSAESAMLELGKTWKPGTVMDPLHYLAHALLSFSCSWSPFLSGKPICLSIIWRFRMFSSLLWSTKIDQEIPNCFQFKY